MRCSVGAVAAVTWVLGAQVFGVAALAADLAGPATSITSIEAPARIQTEVQAPGYRGVAVDPALLRPDSIMVFGGAMSTDDLGNTLMFNLHSDRDKRWDNYIVGAAYDHDFMSLGHGFVLGAEIGIADRFGKYELCCDTVVKSSGVLSSGELWVGARLSYDGTVVFNAVKIGAAATVGFSFTTDSIEREREREIGYGGSARVLGYLAPELNFSLVDHPEWQFVYRVQHRSGAGGLLGHIREGYNANVVGVRYRF